MPWLKHVILDLLVAVLIVLAAVQQVEWARWLVLGYTPFLLLLKLGAFFGTGIVGQVKRSDDAVPSGVYHVLYAFNVGVLLAFSWWLLGGAWALIWLLSFATERKLKLQFRTN